jgi:hypothetical protein
MAETTDRDSATGKPAVVQASVTGNIPAFAVGNRLSDHDFACLLDEIAYAASNQFPIPEMLERVGNARLGRVGRVAKSVTEQLRDGRSLADAVSGIKSPSAGLVSHAFSLGSETCATETCATETYATETCAAATGVGNGDSPSQRGDHFNANLMSRLAHRIRDRADAIRVQRLLWFYPLVLLVVAYAVVVFAVIPMINKFQYDAVYRRDGIRWEAWMSDLATWVGDYPLIPPILSLMAWLLVCFAMRRRPCFTASVRKSLFCHAMADQLVEGVPEHHAITTASALSGYDCGVDEPGSDSLPSLNSTAIVKLLNEAGGLHPDSQRTDGQCKQDQDQPDAQKAAAIGTAAQFRYLGTSYHYQSRKHQRFWTVVVPQFLTLVFGFLFMTGYAWWVIRPIYREVQQW